MTVSVLCRERFLREDGVATDEGHAQAAKVIRDERRWEIARQLHRDEALCGRYDGLTPIETVLTKDEIAEIDRRIGRPALLGGMM